MKKVTTAIVIFFFFLAANSYSQPSAGGMWMDPSALTYRMIGGSCAYITSPEKFTTRVLYTTGTQKLAAYGITLTFGTSVMNPDGLIGTSGVEAGADGFVAAVNANDPGKLVVSGFDTVGKGPGAGLELLVIHWIAVAPGTTTINLTVQTAVDPSGSSVGSPSGLGSTVTVLPSLYGDVNGTDTIDILDALMLAQAYIGLNPQSYNSCLADVNKNGTIDIVDALLIAQLYVGLITEFPISTPGTTPDTGTPFPTPTCLPCSTDLYVHVYDAVTQQPIQGACVTSSLCTDSSGYVHLPGRATCEAGFQASVTITATGYVAQTKSGTFSCGQHVYFYLESM